MSAETPTTPPMPTDAGAVPLQRMRELLDVSRQLGVTVDLDRLLPLICSSATKMVGADRCSLFLHDSVTGELWTKVALGMGAGREIRVPAGKGIVGLVFNSREMLVIPDAYADDRFNRAVDLSTGYRTRNLLTAPVFDLDGKPVAVLQVVNKLGEGPRGAFDASDELLVRLLADQAGVAIQRWHLQRKALEAAAMEKEMDLARRVQERLIPTVPPEVRGLKVAGWNRPASKTGGDAYDLWTTRDGRLAVFVADATGHGIAPALVVSQARAVVRVMTDRHADPHDILAGVNERLAQDLDAGMFVTAFFALISPEGEVCWSSAGHGPVLMRSRPGAEIEELMPPGPPLGVVEEFLASPCPPCRIEPGGWLAVVTDGITESWSPEGEQFGEPRLRDCLEGHAHDGPTALLAALRECLSGWQRTREPSDDQTVVMINRT